MTLTVEITVHRDWRYRVGLALMRLSGWFVGMAVETASFRPKTLVRRPGGRWDAFDDESEAERFRKQLDSNEPHLDMFNVTFWESHLR